MEHSIFMRESEVYLHASSGEEAPGCDDLSQLSAPERLAALQRTELFDSAPDPTFDRFTRIACRLLSTPISLVTLVDHERQFFMSASGPGAPWQSQNSTPLSHSLCKYVAAEKAKLIIENARTDARFASSGAVQEMGVVAYLGVPIFTPGSEAIGSFCVMDEVARSWTPGDVRALEDLGALVNSEVGIRWRIGERKRLAELLKNDDRFAECIADISPAALFVYDAPDGRSLYINQELWPALGYQPDDIEALGVKVLQRLMHPNDFPRFQEHLRHLRASPNNEPHTFEYRMRHADGEWRWFYSRDTILSRDGAGKVTRIAGSALDITLLKKAEQALRDADRRKDEFLATLAHELRNPLAAIRHAVEVLKEAAPDPESLAWARTVLDRQSHQLAAIVDDLIDVARITHGKVSLHKTPMDLEGAVQRTVQMLTPLAQSRHQHLEMSISGETLWVEADPARLEQIIVNLITNAIKYSDDEARIWVQVSREGNELLLRVRDTGIGIEADSLERIFELFAQVPATSERGSGGLGIGLTLIKRLAEMHGGSVTVFSEGRGKGSEFCVHLPALNPSPPSRDEPPAAAENAAAPPPRAKRQPERILIVDDNEDSARGLARILDRRGYTVQTVHQGTAALSASQEFQPDVVLLDIGLPGMNGHQVAEQLRAHGFRETLLLAITGYGQEQDIARSREAGFNFHFVKPVELAPLLAAIEGHEPAPETRL